MTFIVIRSCVLQAVFVYSIPEMYGGKKSQYDIMAPRTPNKMKSSRKMEEPCFSVILF